MIVFTAGNLLKDDAEALVNTVNCVGVMGRGVALQFKKAFPANFTAYESACKRDEVQPGRLFVFETGELTPPRYIVNFPTKRHWRAKSRLEDVVAGLDALVDFLKTKKVESIALPPLGAGLGGLDWAVVRNQIEAKLADLPDVRVVVYEPKGAPAADKMAKSEERPKMTPGQAALVGLMKRYLRGLLDPVVSLLEVHKMMYFLQEAGQPLKLQYKKAAFGPYAENLRQVLNRIEGHFVEGYADGGDAPTKQLTLKPGAFDEAEKLLNSDEAMQSRFDRVSGLVDGFESPLGMELLATVHWVAHYEGATSREAITKSVYDWGDHKKRFTERQIGLAHRTLSDNGWLDAPPAEKAE